MKQEQVDELRQAASQFIISNTVARGLRTFGNMCFGVMLALIVVWFLYRPDLVVMIIAALFTSTIGVMGHILGWFTGTGNRIVAAAKLAMIEQDEVWQRRIETERAGFRRQLEPLAAEQRDITEALAVLGKGMLELGTAVNDLSRNVQHHTQPRQGVEPDRDEVWLEDVAEAFKLGQQVKRPEPPQVP